MSSVYNHRLGPLTVGPTVDCTTAPDYVEAGFCTEFSPETPSSPSWDASPTSVALPCPLNFAFFAINDEHDPVNATQTDSLPCPTHGTGRIICGIAYHSSPAAPLSTPPPCTGSSTNSSRSASATYISGLTTPSTTPSNKGKTTASRWAKKPYPGEYIGLDPSLDMDDFEEIDLHPLPFEYEDQEEEEKEGVHGLELRIANLVFDAEEYEDADLGLGTLEYYLDEGDEGLGYEDMDCPAAGVDSRAEDGEGEEVFFDADVVRALEEKRLGIEMSSAQKAGAETFNFGQKMKGVLDLVRG